MTTIRIFDPNTTEWAAHPLFPYIQTKLFETRATHPWASVLLVQVAVGQGIDTHIHPTETETAYFIRGEGQLTHGEEQTVFKAGMAVSIPPGLPHSLRNVGDEPLEALAFHMPGIR